PARRRGPPRGARAPRGGHREGPRPLRLPDRRQQRRGGRPVRFPPPLPPPRRPLARLASRIEFRAFKEVSMADRKVADCRKFPSEKPGSVTISGPEEEVMTVATQHAG